MVRFLYFFVAGQGAGHVQSLVLGGVVFIVGLVTVLIGLVADLISFNRQLIEITLQKVTAIELALVQRDTEIGEAAAAHSSGFDAETVRRELATRR
jgi:hypothetical protein